jgi:hypothetical protein
MKRVDVYKLIDVEREYQNSIRKTLQQDTVADEDKSPEAFLLYIEEMLNQAKKEAYKLNREGIQDHIRKIAGLAVASIEAFGAPPRIIL